MTSEAQKRAAARKSPWERFADDLAAGKHDEHIAELAEALRERVESGAAIMRWRVELGDLSFAEDELTLDEALAIEREAGLNWSQLEPLASAEHAYALLLVGYRSRLGLEDKDARARLSKLTVVEVVESVHRYTAPRPTTPPA